MVLLHLTNFKHVKNKYFLKLKNKYICYGFIHFQNVLYLKYFSFTISSFFI